MSKSAIDYPYIFARQIAERYLSDVMTLCERAEIVGSLRRRREFIHDIEFLVIPHSTPITDMFGGIVSHESHLEANFIRLASRWGAVILRSGPKLKQLQLPEGIILEICVSDAERWPVEIVIKTGPSEFSKKVVTSRRMGGYLPSWATIKDGWKVYKDTGPQITFQTEGEFLQFLGLGWVEPKDRSPELRSQ